MGSIHIIIPIWQVRKQVQRGSLAKSCLGIINKCHVELLTPDPMFFIIQQIALNHYCRNLNLSKKKLQKAV